MQEQQYGKTELNKKQINVLFSCIDVDTESSIESVWELIEFARPSCRGKSLNGEQTNVLRTICVSETSVYSPFNQLSALECIIEFSCPDTFKLYVYLRIDSQGGNYSLQGGKSRWMIGHDKRASHL
jgi:hypothetical protein